MAMGTVQYPLVRGLAFAQCHSANVLHENPACTIIGIQVRLLKPSRSRGHIMHHQQHHSNRLDVNSTYPVVLSYLGVQTYHMPPTPEYLETRSTLTAGACRSRCRSRVQRSIAWPCRLLHDAYSEVMSPEISLSK